MTHKSKLSSIISRICTTALAMLGYSCSSSSDDDVFSISLMYGVIVSSFEVKGAVTSEEGVPISDAEIIVTIPEIDSSATAVALSETDEKGNYVAYNESGGTYDNLKIVCIPKGKEFSPDSVKVPAIYKYDKKHKKTDWYKGHAELTVDFKLKKDKGE